jgi:predicted hotdog family 3-hydroxylacyl-ACP dehydratase
MPTLPLDIEKLIPHRERMKLIQEVVEAHAGMAVTSSVVSERWPLCQGSFVDPLVLIEIVAQTAAVQICLQNGIDAGVNKLGWVVGIKNVDFFCDRLPLQTILIATVQHLYGVENYDVLAGTVTAGTETLCRMQIQVLRAGQVDD